MLYRDIVTLIAITITVNDMGDSVETETRSNVYADKLPVNQNEVYQAMSHGLKPSTKFKIRFSSYSDQQRFEYKSRQYKILRTYTPDDEWVEITGEAILNANA